MSDLIIVMLLLTIIVNLLAISCCFNQFSINGIKAERGWETELEPGFDYDGPLSFVQ